MTSNTAPVRRRSPVVVEWVYVRYRTVLLVAGAAVLAAAFGVWWFAVGRGTGSAEPAAAAVEPAAAQETSARIVRV
jgi:hypothetical protein